MSTHSFWLVPDTCGYVLLEGEAGATSFIDMGDRKNTRNLSLNP